MKKGHFITFEGPDGSGKTTVSTAIYKQLQSEGYDVIYTREPGGIDIAEQIRDVILNPKNTAMDEKTEALLYAASRRQHLVEKIKPAIEKGQIIICDRFVDSSLAYQGVGRHLGIDEVFQINQFAIEGMMPEKTIYLKLSAEEGLNRIATRKHKDRLDQEALEFHYEVVRGYEAVVEKFKDRMIIIDASQNEEAVIEQSMAAVLEILHDER